MGVDTGLKTQPGHLLTGAFSVIRANLMGCRLEGMSSTAPTWSYVADISHFPDEKKAGHV